MTGTRTASAATIERRHGRLVASAEDSGGKTSGDRARPRPVANNLPLTLDALVGRDEDLAHLRELLGHHRLVTVTGAPGMGKTRLAVEVARAHESPDGVALVALAPLANPDLVVSALASALRIRGAAGPEILDHLVAAIGDQHLLVVLDNCEHVIDACARLAAGLVESCPNLRILATSQERLGVNGERVWPLSGLAVEADDPDGSAVPSAAADAVRLFEQRAQAAKPRFAVTDENLGDVVDICRRLDGIPLAIELAAARVATFSPADIARRLDDRFGFLTGGSRAVLPRHQTLQAAVDWSYDLLTDAEQALLRRLSVFAGGASIEAIEQVCAGNGVDADGVVDLLTALAAKSLVVVPDGAAASRFGLLETIRFYGRDRLAAAGEVTATAARHVRWCVALAEEAEPHLTGPDQNDWLARLQADHDNLRMAMSWSLDQGPTEAALRMSAALAMFWRIAGHFGEGLGWLQRSMAVGGEADAALRARAWWGGAMMAAMLGRWNVATGAARASLSLYEEQDDRRGIGRSLLLLAGAPMPDRSVAEQLGAYQQTIAVARQAEDSWCLAHALALCGSALGYAGDPGAARPMLEESITVARAADDERGLRFGLISLGRAVLKQGDYSTAEESLGEVLALMGSSGEEYEKAVACTGLAEVAFGKGDLASARHLLAEAGACARATTSGQMTEIASMNAHLSLAEGDLDSAERHLADCVESIRAAGCSPGISTLLDLGEIALARGDDAKAEDLLTRALEAARARGYPHKVASALCLLGELARRLGNDDVKARALHHEALLLRVDVGHLPGVVASLEAMAGLAVSSGQADRATRVFASAQAVRDANRFARPGQADAGYCADVARARHALGAEGFDAAWEAGVSMSAEAAVSYLSKGRGARSKRPVSGLAALTDAERQVANLVIEGLSNAEIAERLFVSIYTVKTHLKRVFVKVPVSSRSELIRRFPRPDL